MKFRSARLPLVALMILSIAACGAPTIRPDAKLQSSEGVLIASLDCSGTASPAWVEIYASGLKSSGYSGSFRKSAVLSCHPRKRELDAVILPAGRYFIGKIGSTKFRDIGEGLAISFSVSPGTLTYVGNFPVGSFSLRINDQEAEAKSEIGARFPELSSRYPWLKAIARGPGR